MLTLSLIVVNIVVAVFGVYQFDYKVDNVVNNPLVIILSIIIGTVIALIFALVYIEGFYLLVAKRKPINSKLMHALANQFMAVPLHVSNTRVKVIGRENLPKDPGFSIYSNHTSMMDIPVLMCNLRGYPVAFLAKKIVTRLFGIGKWTPALGCVSLDRENSRKGAEAIIQVIKNVKNGSTMVIFPEGTRTREIGSLIDFKPGSFKVALKSKAPLVPVTIVKANNFNIIKWPFAKKIKVVIHKPLPFDEFKGMNTQDLSNKVREVIESAL
ncbi:1-acyl-sn-glycerol-3-phosphate acyltransferase [Candidatus Izimaplasma bacterium HR1]|jgi:1-acyl-sn-glycerol-3-phosphate acyltransferase|uniref:lysophospholipid acyltransferase family protein n=1 Tax=Candidatus Izimoplasma sp. HR1 TaxID=1541959 RepID=UPI0004F85E3F|nr:1-acyl-sn-glycerol-3-phosphate acyltransferase [Candidatus Izimaplasma bacterium HR1]